MFRKNRSNLILIIVLISNTIISQVTKDLPNYFPVSPNAASFAKQGLFPVDYYTGKLNISIPLYTIKTKELNVPISVSYNTAGIQLDELASWVGLGWNLNAGGAVVRNVKGIPDNGAAVPNITNLSFTASNYNILFNQYNPYWAGAGGTDSAYDEFIINAPGLSGTFYFVDNKAIFKDLQNTTIKTSSIANKLLNNTQTLEITKNDGTIYRFGQSLDGYNANEIVHNTTDINKSDYISTWYLTEIIPPNSKNPFDFVLFKYKLLANTSDYPIIIGEQLADNNIMPNVTPSLKSIFPEKTSSNKQFLTSINFNNGIIEFSSAQNRQDLIDDYKLDKISIFSIKGITKTLIQEYGFVYDYYNRTGGSTTTSPQYYTTIYPTYNDTRNLNSRNKSLRLIQLTNNILNTKHTFQYESSQLPLRGTTKKDYWGYINSNTGNLSPPTLLTRQSPWVASQNFSVTVGDGNRTANENLMKSGILQKITYPEGGYSIFEYEANRYFQYVTTPTIADRSETAIAYGSGCSYNAGPNTSTKTFTPSSTYVPGSGKITYSFTEASQENGLNTKVTFDSTIYFRPPPSGSKYPAGGASFNFDFGNSTYTLGAYEYRTGFMGASGCPFSYITASWKEVTNAGTPVLTARLMGGLRIKSVKSYDGKNSNAAYTKLYQYDNENILIREGNGSYVRGMFEGNSKSDIIPVFSTSAIFDSNIGGSPVITYGKVTELDSNSDNTQQNGKTEYFYENIPLTRLFDINAGNLPTVYKSPYFNISQSYDITLPLNYLGNFGFYKNDLWNQGSLLKTNIYKTGATPNTYKIIKSIVNQYSILKQSTLSYNIVFNNDPSQQNPGEYLVSFNLPYNQNNDYHSGVFYYAVGQTSQGKKVITSTIETDYNFDELPTTQKTITYGYENPIHNEVTKTEIINSKKETLRTQLSYPQDLLSNGQTTEMQKLIDQNKIDKPIKTETFVNNVQTSESITKYEESSVTGGLLLPKEIHSSKGTVETFPFSAANRKINFTLYDTDLANGATVGNGNVLEYSIENGTPVSIIWGYNKTQPIAKIENATYSQVSSYVSNLQNVSNTGTETDLINALNNLRTSLPNAMITTYTFLPLIGVSTITDPKGDTITYTYDSFGRLQFVKDKNNNILSENQYNYKQ
jgi:YD repeat-containing protein